jgi:hypothetical protein
MSRPRAANVRPENLYDCDGKWAKGGLQGDTDPYRRVAGSTALESRDTSRLHSLH